METRYHARFIKHYQKRIAGVKFLRERTDERIALFVQDPQDPLLKDHPLKGAKAGLRAFSVTGDYRVVYEWRGNVVIFIDVGTHNQVY